MAQSRTQIKLLYYILAVLVLAGGVPFYFYGSRMIDVNREALRTKEREFQTATTRALAAEIGLYHQSKQDSLDELADSISILSNGDLGGSRIGFPELRGKVEDAVRGSELNLYAGVMNPVGRALTASRIGTPSGPLQAAIDRAYVNGLAGRKTNTPLLDFNGGIRLPVMVRGMPLGSEPQVYGAVVQVEDFSAIERQFDELMASGLQTFVVDSKGRVVLSSRSARLQPGQDASRMEVVSRFLSWNGKPLASETLTYDQVERDGSSSPMLATYSAVPDLGWAVIAQRPEKAAFAGAEQLDREEYAALVLLLAASVGLGVYLSTRVTRPLGMLTDQAQALARRELHGRIRLKDRTEIGLLAENFNSMSEEIERFVEELKRAAELQRELFLGSVRLLAQAVDEKDPYTRGHSDRVSRYSEAIALRLRLPEDVVDEVRLSAQLHDVGKIVIDDAILKKPGKLTPEEFDLMKLHTIKGANIVRQVERMRNLVPGIELHHESLDGTGYPHGLVGEEIPLIARIIAVADTFDAMTTTRPYQTPMSLKQVLEFLQSKAGIRYASDVLAAFFAAVDAGEIKPAERPKQTAVAATAESPLEAPTFF